MQHLFVLYTTHKYTNSFGYSKNHYLIFSVGSFYCRRIIHRGFAGVNACILIFRCKNPARTKQYYK
jgi:hypothetical protein